jgi:Zn-dependent protease with chaperone function
VTYLLYGATLGFTWFLALNVALSCVIALVARAAMERLADVDAHLRARTLLSMRLLPAVVSTIFVAGVFLPSFLRLEPRNFDEAFGITTTTFAAASCVLLAAALWRGASALADAARRTRAWLRDARPIQLEQSPVPAFCLDAPVPAMTLVGVVRPKLLVTKRLLDVLSGEELAAAIVHESGHHGSRDNLKRLLMRATPDALSVLAISRRLEHEWALAAEHAADAHAAGDQIRGLALASALLKVARLTPAEKVPALVSPLVGGEAIASRVSKLVQPPHALHRSLMVRAAVPAAAIGALGIVVANYGPLLQAVHNISEVVVRVLP